MLKKMMTGLLAIVALTFTGFTSANAQDTTMMKRGKHHMAMLNLTPDQQTKMDGERIAHMKVMNGLRNEMDEKKARLNTLMETDKPDMKVINQVIDEVGALKTKMMKQKAEHVQKIRTMLTDEQKVIFDSHKGKMGHGDNMFDMECGKGMKQGKGQGCMNDNGCRNDHRGKRYLRGNVD